MGSWRYFTLDLSTARTAEEDFEIFRPGSRAWVVLRADAFAEFRTGSPSKPAVPLVRGVGFCDPDGAEDVFISNPAGAADDTLVIAVLPPAAKVFMEGGVDVVAELAGDAGGTPAGSPSPASGSAETLLATRTRGPGSGDIGGTIDVSGVERWIRYVYSADDGATLSANTIFNLQIEDLLGILYTVGFNPGAGGGLGDDARHDLGYFDVSQLQTIQLSKVNNAGTGNSAVRVEVFQVPDGMVPDTAGPILIQIPGFGRSEVSLGANVNDTAGATLRWPRSWDVRRFILDIVTNGGTALNGDEEVEFFTLQDDIGGGVFQGPDTFGASDPFAISVPDVSDGGVGVRLRRLTGVAGSTTIRLIGHLMRG